ncbi:hypothetical protein V8F20_009391 [Naviculisporaceae sp. PSN 640]
MDNLNFTNHPTTSQHQRSQSILERLSAALPSTSQAVRRLLGVASDPIGSSTSAAMSPVKSADQVIIPGASSEEKPTTQHVIEVTTQISSEERADPDAPVGMLLPGMSNLTVYNPPNTPNTAEEEISTTPPVPAQDLPDTTVPQKEFISPPSKTPNLLLTLLPLEIQSAIFAQPVLNLEDMMTIRRTCRTWRRDIPISILDQKLRTQNYAGWQVVFEVNGNKYQGTTYGNRRLCGRCVVPKIRAHLIRGDCVGQYLSTFVDESIRYARIYRTDCDSEKRRDVQGEWWEWPEDRGMCFPCLWKMLEENVHLNETATAETKIEEATKTLHIDADGGNDIKETGKGMSKSYSGITETQTRRQSGEKKEESQEDSSKQTDDLGKDTPSPDFGKTRMIKLAAIEKKQQWTMMDGTLRKLCDEPGCLRDIHENAVPCPHCADFSKWLSRPR